MRRPPSPTVSGRGTDDNADGGVKKGPWTPEEDKKLVDYITKYGHGSWRAIPKLAGLNRCGKSCRLRWTNYLRPDIKRGKFSEEEEQLIIKLHSVLGNKWSAIATRLPGRTDNEIKNHWNTHLRKRLLQMGIDPITHRPRTDFNFITALANLPQLVAAAAAANNVTNPLWDSINTLRVCSDAAQMANELQLLQNFMALQLQLQSNVNTTTMEAQNQLLDHLALLNPQWQAGLCNFTQLLPNLSCSGSVTSDIQIPRPGIILNDGKTTTNSNVSIINAPSSSSSSLKVPSGDDIPSNPIFPGAISVSPLPENPSSVADWPTEKERYTVSGSPNHVPSATTFEAWGDVKMDDDEAADSYWQDIFEYVKLLFKSG